MKLFVLGGSGLIGKELIKKAIDNHQVFATYNNTKLKIPKISIIKFSFPEDLEELKKKIVVEKPNVVINLIGISKLNFCEKNKEEAYGLNVFLTDEISKICNKIDSKFVHISTDYVFDGENGNYKENDKTNPINYYGFTKQISEKKTLRYTNNIIIRTSFVYDLKFKSTFLKFILEKLNINEKVIVFNNIFTTPILVDELVESILQLIIRDKSGIFHISGDECISRFDFVKIIAKKMGYSDKLVISGSVKTIKSKILRPKNSCLNNSKIKKVLGVKFSNIEKNVDKMRKISDI